MLILHFSKVVGLTSFVDTKQRSKKRSGCASICKKISQMSILLQLLVQTVVDVKSSRQLIVLFSCRSVGLEVEVMGNLGNANLHRKPIRHTTGGMVFVWWYVFFTVPRKAKEKTVGFFLFVFLFQIVCFWCCLAF